MKPLPSLAASIVSLLALGLLFVATARHPAASQDDGSPDALFAASPLTPDSRISVAKAILLRRQYEHYLRCRQMSISSPRREEAVRDYNLSSQECWPDVFGRAHLPRAVQ